MKSIQEMEKEIKDLKKELSDVKEFVRIANDCLKMEEGISLLYSLSPTRKELFRDIFEDCTKD